MTTYIAYICTDAGFTTHHFDVDTPEQALALAQRLNDDDPSQLCFEPYDPGMPVNEIAICDSDDNELAVWRDEDLILRLAARDLLEAAQLVVARWERGDLAEAVRALDAAIAKAKGGSA